MNNDILKKTCENCLYFPMSSIKCFLCCKHDKRGKEVPPTNWRPKIEMEVKKNE